MTRLLYQALLRMHPPFFRREFAAEMLWIFDSSVDTEGAARLFFDGLVSLARQWLLRSGSWKIAVALAGGLLQVTMCGFGLLIFGNQQSASFSDTASYSGDWVGSLQSARAAAPIELAVGRNGGGWLGSLLTTDSGETERSDVLDFQSQYGAVRFRIATPDGEMLFRGRLSGGKLAGTFEKAGEGGSGQWEVVRNRARSAGANAGVDDLVRITVCLVPGIILSVVLLALWTRTFTHKRIHGFR